MVRSHATNGDMYKNTSNVMQTIASLRSPSQRFLIGSTMILRGSTSTALKSNYAAYIHLASANHSLTFRATSYQKPYSIKRYRNQGFLKVALPNALKLYSGLRLAKKSMVMASRSPS